MQYVNVKTTKSRHLSVCPITAKVERYSDGTENKCWPLPNLFDLSVFDVSAEVLACAVLLAVVTSLCIVPKTQQIKGDPLYAENSGVFFYLYALNET